MIHGTKAKADKSARAAKIAKNKLDERIDRAFKRRCEGIQIGVMDLGKIFTAGYEAVAKDPTITDEALADAVFAFVQTIRKN